MQENSPEDRHPSAHESWRTLQFSPPPDEPEILRHPELLGFTQEVTFIEPSSEPSRERSGQHPTASAQRQVGRVAAGSELHQEDKDPAMAELVERLITQMPAADLYKRNELLRRAFKTAEVSLETARRFWREFERHPSVFPTGSQLYSHRVLPSHMSREGVSRFWEMNQAVEGIMDYFFDRYLDKPFPPSYLIDYAKEIEVWPSDQSERDLFYKLMTYHPRNKTVEDGGLIAIAEPDQKPYQKESIPMTKRVELLYRTRKEAVVANERWIAHKIFGRGDQYTPEEHQTLREAIDQNPHFVPIGGSYTAWEIVPPNGVRDELDASRAMVENLIRTLEAKGVTERMTTNFLLKTARSLGFSDPTRRVSSILVMYLRAHPRLRQHDGLFSIRDADENGDMRLPFSGHLQDAIGRRFQQRDRGG